MRDKILEIVNNSPKHYSRMIKNDVELYKWVLSNKKTNSENFSAQIYSAVYDISDVCEYGNIKKFNRWSTGFVGCGPASKCICTKNNISKSVKHTKQNISKEEQKKINEKRKNTMLDKYGVEYNSQRSEIKPILKKTRVTPENYEYLSNYERMYEEYINNKRTSVDIALELGIHNSTVIEHLRNHNFDIRKTSSYSLIEKQIKEFIESYGISVLENDRNVLDGKELDLLIPEKNIAIEVNGLYWHSYGINDKENKRYHLDKKEKCLDKGINLLHITDYDWNNKKNIIKSMLKSKLDLTERIYARKCNIVELDVEQAYIFFDKNHLDGFSDGSLFHVGLEYNNEVVMCMSVGKRFCKWGVIELYRMASILDTTIVGGMSKILNYFMKKYRINTIYSECDFSYSDGNAFKRNGFNFKGKSDPDCFWTDGNNIINNDCDNMMESGFRRYWNCGFLMFQLER